MSSLNQGGRTRNGRRTADAWKAARLSRPLVVTAGPGPRISDSARTAAASQPRPPRMLLELWPIFEAFQTKYIAGALILDAEKNA